MIYSRNIWLPTRRWRIGLMTSATQSTRTGDGNFKKVFHEDINALKEEPFHVFALIMPDPNTIQQQYLKHGVPTVRPELTVIPIVTQTIQSTLIQAQRVVGKSMQRGILLYLDMSLSLRKM